MTETCEVRNALRQMLLRW